ncbi:hypothetical protein ACQU6D_27345 (plasmid) [Klebsiella variicola]|jgi:hypothetical protein|nr:hypothetical protein [Enterobacter roggenkampii]UPQ69486.1 hypothetical protein M0769_24585 [Enterobacter roggenkampii]
MSAKDEFFRTVESNAKTQKEAEEDFKREVLAFQEDTKKLILEIKEWFAGSPVTASVGTMQVIENTDRFEVSNLTLKNGSKTLTINPEGFAYFGVTGCLKVSIHNPNRAPATSKFSLHWKDGISKISGWVIVYGEGGNTPAQRVQFNQESFFTMIKEFA